MFVSIGQFQFDAHEDLAKAAATSLRKSGLFKDCYFTFGEKGGADLLLTGEIRSTTYRGAVYSYGLSVFGPLLWFFGLPAGSSQDELAIRFEMKDAKTKQTIWEHTYNGQKKIVQGLYYRMGHDALGYAELMEDAMNEALPDLDRTLGAKFAVSK